MSGVLLRRVDGGEEAVLELRGLFCGIGHTPNGQLLEGQVELDEIGYILVKEGTVKTSVEGVFAAGNVQDHEWRQAITAAGSGCTAALAVERYLVSNALLVEFHQPVAEEVKKKELSNRDVEMGFDITLTKHRGQYALRKMYHESLRLICVLCTSPACRPCRTLKPILSKEVHVNEGARVNQLDCWYWLNGSCLNRSVIRHSLAFMDLQGLIQGQLHLSHKLYHQCRSLQHMLVHII